MLCYIRMTILKSIYQASFLFIIFINVDNLRRVQAKFNVDEFATEIMEIKHKVKRKHDKDIRDLEKNTNLITSQLKTIKEETKNKISNYNYNY